MNNRMMQVAVAALLLGVGSAAPAREYTLMIYERADQLALRTDTGAQGQAYWAAFAGIGQDMAKAGVLRGGAPLDPRGSEATLKLSGYLIVDVADTATAQAWAARIPAAVTGRVDIYPHAAAKTGM
jgi:hypothetical protein